MLDVRRHGQPLREQVRRVAVGERVDVLDCKLARHVALTSFEGAAVVMTRSMVRLAISE